MHKIFRYRPSAFSSFQFCDYVQSTKTPLSGNNIKQWKGPATILNMTLCVISLNTALDSYKRVNVDSSNVEIQAILKSFFVKWKSFWERFREINSIWRDGTE